MRAGATRWHEQRCRGELTLLVADRGCFSATGRQQRVPRGSLRERAVAVAYCFDKVMRVALGGWSETRRGGADGGGSRRRRRPEVARGPVICSPDERSEIRGQRSSLWRSSASLICSVPPRASAPCAFASHAPRASSRRQRVCRARPLFECRVGSIALRRDADEARHHPLAHAYRLDMRLAQHALLRFRADAHRKAIGLQRREGVL
jgi:hypothetical protein